MRASLKLLATVLAISCVGTAIDVAVAQKNMKAAPAPDFLVGPPFSLETLLTFFGTLKEDRILSGLKARGISFQSTPAVLTRLRSAGAPDSVVALVREIGTPRPASVVLLPPPPRTPKLKLFVRCDPAECQVRVGEASFRTTKDGEISFDELNPGRVIVDAMKDGFVPSTKFVELKDADSADVTKLNFSLTPTEETQAHWGHEMKQRLLRDFSAEAKPRTITGTLGSSDTATKFDFVARFQGNGSATFELQSPAGYVVINCVARHCIPSTRPLISRLRGRKQFRVEDAVRLIPQLDSFLALEFEEFVSMLRTSDSEVKAASDPATGAGQKALRVGSTTGAYVLQLDAELRPAGVVYQSNIGVGAGIHVAYSDYIKLDGAEYPSITEFRGSAEAATAHSFHVKTITHSVTVPASTKAN